MLAGSQSALLVLSHNMSQPMSQSLMKEAIDACEESYSVKSELAAVEAVEKWLRSFDACEKPNSEESKDAAVAAVEKWLREDAGVYKGEKAILAVASENGYLEVVKRLLKNEGVVNFELNARAEELKERAKEGVLSSTSKGFQFVFKATPSGFTLARQAASKGAEKSPEDWNSSRMQMSKQVRCTSCYDMITLYTYIGEEIPDVTTLHKVIDALRKLGWVTMDDIQDHWNDVRESLRKEIERSLVKKLSEARYTYGSWNKQFKDEDKFNDEDKTMWLMITECPRAMLLQLLSLVFAIIVSLLIFVPVFVLIFHYDLVHYEEQLWSECFMYLGIFALAQIVFAFLAAPYTGWGMIKESSRDADLGVTLRGSMHTCRVLCPRSCSRRSWADFRSLSASTLQTMSPKSTASTRQALFTLLARLTQMLSTTHSLSTHSSSGTPCHTHACARYTECKPLSY